MPTNAHDVQERLKAIFARLKARGRARNEQAPDLTAEAFRRRAYRAARRIEEARAARGDTRPFLADPLGRDEAEVRDRLRGMAEDALANRHQAAVNREVARVRQILGFSGGQRDRTE